MATAVKTTESYGNSLGLLAPWSETFLMKRDYAYYFLVPCVFLDILIVLFLFTERTDIHSHLNVVLCIYNTFFLGIVLILSYRK